MRVVVDLRAGFGRYRMSRLRRAGDGSVSMRSGPLYARLQGLPDVHTDDNGWISISLVVPAGQSHDLVLEVSDRRLPEERVDVGAAWSATEHAWHEAVPEFDESAAPRDARHSYAVMRGLTVPGGGMVAAVTLGIPERAEAGRNYDYRYVWLRDQAFAGIAVGVSQPHPLLDDAVAFATARLHEHGDQIAPAYRVDGTELPSEMELPLPGYPGGRDVVGNWVNGQFQLDSLGEMLVLFATAARHDRLDSDALGAVQLATRAIEKRWTDPEAGIWELEDAWWTESRLACVAGLRSMAAHLPRGEGSRLTALADAILAETSTRCLDASGAWRRSPDQEGPDASLVLAPVHGAVPATDPRTLATLEAVRRDLAVDQYVYRFAPDNQPLGDAEGAFLLCGFMMALAEWHQGNVVEAFRWFERNRASCGPPGLFAEEYDVRQRQLRGNLPQAFVHAAMLEASMRLATPPPR
jgi:GH15 family glucan-1,4-alpha-glucosidase